MKTRLTQRNVKAATSKDILRPSMKGVYHDTEASVLVATNGHMLIVWPYETDKDKVQPAGIIPISAFPTKQPHIYSLSLDETHVTTKRCGGESKERLIDEEYPDYKSIIPDQEGPATLEIGIDLEVLKRIHDAIPGNDKRVVMRFIAPNRSVYITPRTLPHNSDTFEYAICMPFLIEP